MADTAPSTDAHAARTLLTDAFGRIAEQVAGITDGLQDDEAVWRPDPGANTVAWLLWHLARVQDDHIATLAGVEQAWTAQGWYERFGLTFKSDATGYAHSSGDVGRVRAPAADLAGYHADVRALTQRYLDGVKPAELQRVVDENWDPPVTASVRIVSVVNDCTDHVGQAEYVLGMARRR